MRYVVFKRADNVQRFFRSDVKIFESTNFAECEKWIFENMTMTETYVEDIMIKILPDESE